MQNIINSQTANIAYIELKHNKKCRIDLCFAWIDDQLFLPAAMLDNDPARAVSRALVANIDVYSRGIPEYFIPYEWLKEQRPDLTELLENIREAAEPFRHKLTGNPCRVCRHYSSEDSASDSADS